MKQRASSTHRMDTPERHNRHREKRTIGIVSLSVCLLVRLCLRWSLTLRFVKAVSARPILTHVTHLNGALRIVPLEVPTLPSM